MKAITYHRYGNPQVLKLEEVPVPACGEKDVLIRVHAAEATKADCEMRSFRFSVLWFWVPLRLALGITAPRRKVLGSYFAGEIVKTGSKADTDLKVGDAVFGTSNIRLGAYGQYAAIPASSTVVNKPANMNFTDAAAVPLGGLNALHFLRLANLQSGQRILILGAGGSIGAYAIQIAKSLGAHVTSVDKASKEAFVRAQGSDDFIDYTTSDPLSGDARYEVIFDMVPGSDFRRCLSVLTPGGHYLLGNARFSAILRAIVTNRVAGRKKVRVKLAAESRQELSELRELIEGGALTSIVDRVLPMKDAAQAHTLVETETRQGAVVIRME